jgi:hypothetical protein
MVCAVRCAGLAVLLLIGCREAAVPEARLHVGTESLDFGQVPVGRTHTRQFSVRNDGNLTLEIAKVSAEGPFKVFPSQLAVRAGEAAELRVRFEPDAEARFESSIVFDSNARGSTVTVALIGVGACTGISCVREDAGVADAAQDASIDEDAGEAIDATSPEDAEPIDEGVDAGVDTGADAGIPGLAAHYGFEESSGTLIDGSGNGNDGAPSGAGLIRGVAGVVGNAVQFEGNVGQFVVQADPTLDAVNALSIELWINTSNLGTTQTILGRGLNTGGDGLFLITQCNNLHVAFSRNGVTGTANATTNCDSFAANTWVHVAIVNDGALLTVYLDGQRTVEATGGFLGAIASPLYLGRREPGVEPYAGFMDELRWWTIARTPEEVCASAQGTFANGVCMR